MVENEHNLVTLRILYMHCIHIMDRNVGHYLVIMHRDRLPDFSTTALWSCIMLIQICVVIGVRGRLERSMQQ